jgi:ectoine hydroxylase-related dioxygenase (phytanoyl-CoA dioxygenase family)
MGKCLTPEQIDRYWSAGFLSPIRVMSEERAAAMRRRVEAIETRFGRIHYLLKPHLVMTAADELAHDETILDAVEDLIGPDILLWDATFIIKEPGDRKHVTWHQDLTYWGLDSVDGVVSIWLALSPATVASGAMRMIPRSHRRGPLRHYPTTDVDNVLSRGQTLEVAIDENEAVDTVLLPGEMSIHHGLTFHASHPNVSNDRRIGFNMNLIRPDVRQLKVEADSAMRLRGTDRYRHYRPEPRPTGDFMPEAVVFQGEIARARGKDVNHDPSGRLVGAAFRGGAQ